MVDIADGALASLNNKESNGKVINQGSEEEISILTITLTIKEEIQK